MGLQINILEILFEKVQNFFRLFFLSLKYLQVQRILENFANNMRINKSGEKLQK